MRLGGELLISKLMWFLPENPSTPCTVNNHTGHLDECGVSHLSASHAEQRLSFCLEENRIESSQPVAVLVTICEVQSFPTTQFLTIGSSFKTGAFGTSVVVQWLTIRLPMQGTRVWALVREDPTCHGATKLSATTTEAHVPRARAPPQEKPRQWEAHTPQQRVAPAHRN